MAQAATPTSSKSISVAPPVPTATAFYDRADQVWQTLSPNLSGTDEQKKAETQRVATATKKLRDHLLSSLQLQHVLVLAGSGTSLGPVGGPSMSALWDHCVNSSPNTDPRTETKEAQNVISKVGYARKGEWWKENIEALLSQCDAYLQFKPGEADVAQFVKNSKETILALCSGFLDPAKSDQLEAHRTFLHRLSRRRVRDSRLKLFTTNYDLCFESAAGKLGLVTIDGFSFSHPRYFDPRFFQYDIVRRTPATSESGTPLEGVFQLLKLHGSVNWERSGETVAVNPKPDPDKACLVYPAKGKYQQSYVQPHLELVSQFFAALREPNTCVLTIGFGFNDDHLSEPILAAVKTNPHIRLVAVSLHAKGCADGTDAGRTNHYWQGWLKLAQEGYDVAIIDTTFAEFVKLIPDLKSLTPAEQLAKSVAALAVGH